MDSQTTKCNDTSYIIDLIKRIDKMQKEAAITEDSECITCQNSLISFANNTIPLLIGLRCGGVLTGNIGTTDTPTTYFKVESIRADKYITFRLLTTDCDTLVATPYTLTMDGDCICYIQCFEPISTTSCNLASL